MSWLEKLLPPKIQQTNPADRRSVPSGLWIKCPSCDSVLYKTDLEQNQNVCPSCSHHHRIGARTRLNVFLDNEGRYEIGQEVLPVDALKFKDSRKYPERVKEALENTGETDALVVTDPTMGGVSAGFAFLGDVVIAEPKALIGFAGPRVIESTMRVTLPEGFQRAEFLQTKGAIDLICDRRELRKTIANTLAMLTRQSADAVS